MQRFHLRTAMGSIAFTTLLSASLVTGNLTSSASKNIGQADLSVRNEDQHFLNLEIKELAGWKIGNWKIVQGAQKAAIAVAEFIDGGSQDMPCPQVGSATPMAIAQLSEREVKIQQSILIEELN